MHTKKRPSAGGQEERKVKQVGATGLEPAASCSQSKHSTKLSYAPLPIYI